MFRSNLMRNIRNYVCGWMRFCMEKIGDHIKKNLRCCMAKIDDYIKKRNFSPPEVAILILLSVSIIYLLSKILEDYLEERARKKK